MISSLYIAFDPGGTTGVAAGYHEGKPLFALTHSFEIPWTERFSVFTVIGDFFQGAAYEGRKLVVVAEDFMPAPRAVASLAQRHVLASEVLGMIELSCNLYGLVLHRQMPAVRKSVQVFTKHAEMVGSSPHRQDSYRHLKYKILESVMRSKNT